MAAYATRQDLHDYGLPPGMLANPGRLCASVLAETDRFQLDDHGLETDDPFLARLEEGGEMPFPLVEGTTYYAIRDSEQYFRAAAAPAGSAIDLQTDGSSVVIATPLPIEKVLEFYSRFVDAFLPAHLVPLTAPYPVTVTALVAELAATRLLLRNGQRSDALDRLELAAKAQLERWAKGVPLRDARATASANLAVSEVVTSDPRGWVPAGGTIP